MSTGRRRFLASLGAVPLVGCSTLGSDHVPPQTPERLHLSLPPILHREHAAGPQLYLLEDHGLPLVSMAVLVRAGHRHERPGQEGLAALAATMLLRGMEGGDRVTLLESYGELGTTPAAVANSTTLGLRCTVQRTP